MSNQEKAERVLYLLDGTHMTSGIGLEIGRIYFELQQDHSDIDPNLFREISSRVRDAGYDDYAAMKAEEEDFQASLNNASSFAEQMELVRNRHVAPGSRKVPVAPVRTTATKTYPDGSKRSMWTRLRSGLFFYGFFFLLAFFLFKTLVH